MLQRFSNFITTKPKAASILISSALMIYYILVSGVKFDTNDDPEMMLINMGVFTGHTDIHNVYINYWVSGCMSWLYSICSYLPWYELLIVGCLTMSVSIINYFIIKQSNRLFLLIFNLLALGLLSKCISNFQFTKTSFILGFAGIVILMNTGFEKQNKLKLLLAFVLLILSGLMRFHAFFMMGVVMIPFCIYQLVALKKIKFSVLIIVAAAIANFALYKAHTNFYYKDKEWKGFLTEMGDKVNIISVGTLTNDTAYFNQQLKTIGWSANDYDAMLHWFFVDTQVYSISKFQTLNKAYPTFQRSWAGGAYTLKLLRFFKETIHYWLCIVCWFALLLFYFKSSKKHQLFLVVHFLYIIGFMFFMFYYLKLEARIFTPIVFALMSITFFYNYQTPLFKGSKWVKQIFVLFLSLSVVAYSVKGFKTYSQAKKNQLKLQSILSEQPTDHKNISLSYGFPFNDLVPLQNCNYLLKANIIPISTLVCSPLFHQSYQRHGITDILKFIGEGNDYTFWVFNGNGIHTIETYYYEHYHISLKFIKINEVGNCYLYKPVIAL